MKVSRRHLLASAAAAAAIVPARGIAVAQAHRTAIVPFEHSAFPYDGPIPDTGKPFLDVTQSGRRGHTSPRGGVYFTEPTYADTRTLLHVGSGFRASQESVMVMFFHGNKATLQGEVLARQRVVAQFDASGINGVLVAPQLAVNALDSSGGRFWESGFFARYLGEAAQRLGQMTGTGSSVFQSMPVVIVAYSGGYNPAAYALERGGAGGRIRGVILLDALFGELPRFAQWIGANHSRAFFVTAYGPASRTENMSLKTMLTGRGIGVQDGAPQRLSGSGVFFIDSRGAAHNDFMTRAWVANPLRDILVRMR